MTQQVNVAASESWRTERGHRGHLVRRIVDGFQAVQQVADLLGLEHQGRAFQAKRYPRVFQPAFQRRQTGATGHEDAHVGMPHRAVGLASVAVGRRLVQGFPLLRDHLPEQEADLTRFFLPDFAYGRLDRCVAQHPHLRTVGVPGVPDPEG